MISVQPHTRPYPQETDTFDEAYDAAGLPRPHWREFLGAFSGLGPAALRTRWEAARRMIHEHGITYNLFGSPDGMQRPWELDPIPYMLSEAEWTVLRRGTAQRARLLDRLLADAYGPRRMVREKLVPPKILFSHPGWLRMCAGALPETERYLHLVAVDLYRAVDGSWRVLADRAEAPSGIGYLLENRVVVSHVLPELFQQCRVQRLAPFYAALKDALTRAAPRHRDDPHIVILSPGPTAEAYFEHSYLSKYLGFTLAEPSDLTVRKNEVFLKTLGGLRPVDVIFRRISASGLDPLLLPHERRPGIPGLLEAVRAGTVTVSNALGSGLVGAPAFMSYMEPLCRAFLDEELLLPSAPTRWLGDDASVDEILSDFDGQMLRTAFRGGSRTALDGSRLSKEERSAIASDPSQYVAFDNTGLSQIPVWDGNGYRPQRMVLRLFAVAVEDGYEVLPGGLTRVADTAQQLLLFQGARGGSKDTWLTSQAPPSTFTLMKSERYDIAVHRFGDLPSRVADDLFWLGRYAERTESQTRLLRSAAERVSEDAELDSYPELPALSELLLSFRLVSALPDSAESLAGAVSSCVLGNPVQGSLAEVTGRMYQSAVKVRDRLSLDAWRIISRVEQPSGDNAASLSRALDVLNDLGVTLSAFSGLAMETMTRGLGWRFLDIGRRLERALSTAALLRLLGREHSAVEKAVLEAVLEIAASSMTFRARYRAAMHPAAVVDLLVHDESNPRSIAFQVAAIAEHLRYLPRKENVRPYGSEEERIVISLLTAIRLSDPIALVEIDAAGHRPALEALLDEAARALPALSDHLTMHYTAHVETMRHLASKHLRDER